MAEEIYTYKISEDLPDGQVNVVNLKEEVLANTDITKALDRIDLYPYGDMDRLDIVFREALSVSGKTSLDGDTDNPAGGMLSSHDYTSTSEPDSVNVNNFAAIDYDDGDGHKVFRFAPQPSTPGYFMCDRDFRLNTGLLSGSFEDLAVNPTTLDRVSWNEIELDGVYKNDPISGWIEVDDQADADANAELSVWTYQAKSQSTSALIPLDIRGGTLYVDTAVQDLSASDKWEHQFYVVMAPDLPTPYGGGVKFFDGYLLPYSGSQMSSLNQLATHLDPIKWGAPYTDLTGTSDGDNTKIRALLYYTKGSKHTHVFRLITYRPPGTF